MTRPPAPIAEGGVVAAPIVAVTGGAGRVSLDTQAALDAASRVEALADHLDAWAVELATMVAPAALAASALEDPVGAAAVTAALTAAGAGPGGLLDVAGRLHDDADAARRAALDLGLVDGLVADALQRLRIGAGVGLWAGLASGAVAGGLVGSALPADVRSETGSALLDALTADPDVAQGMLGLLAAPLGGVPLGAQLLSGLYGADAVTVRTRADLVVGRGTHREDSVAGLVGHLSQVAGLDDPQGGDLEGQIEVQTLHTPDGPRHVVYLPGTDDIGTVPGGRDHTLRDMGENMALVGGVPTAYGAGVLTALHRSGVRPCEPVLIVGHSQGGLQAAAIEARSGGFAVRQVVTLGSPLASASPPPGTRLLALENAHDVVPRTDGAPNTTESRRLTTVTGDPGSLLGTRPGDVLARHGLPEYAAIAAGVDASSDPSVLDQLRALREDGFLGPDDVPTSSRLYQLTRPSS